MMPDPIGKVIPSCCGEGVVVVVEVVVVVVVVVDEVVVVIDLNGYRSSDGSCTGE
jgi:hypothetical protein